MDDSSSKGKETFENDVEVQVEKHDLIIFFKSN